VGALATAMTEIRFDAGETIFTDADPEGRLYIVVDGSVDLSQGASGWERRATG
jgi:CRP-like cAMP-binding protein